MSSIPTQFANVTAVTKANIYFDGKVVSHTVLMPDGAKRPSGSSTPAATTSAPRPPSAWKSWPAPAG